MTLFFLLFKIFRKVIVIHCYQKNITKSFSHEFFLDIHQLHGITYTTPCVTKRSMSKYKIFIHEWYRVCPVKKYFRIHFSNLPSGNPGKVCNVIFIYTLRNTESCTYHNSNPNKNCMEVDHKKFQFPYT